MTDLTDATTRLVEAMLVRDAARERDRLERRYIAPLRRWWTSQARDLRRALNQDAATIVEALSDDWEAAWDQVSARNQPLIVPLFDAEAERALAAGAQHALAEVGMSVNFELDNPRAVAYLRDHGARLVTNIDATTRDQLRTLLTQAVDEGWSWQRTGRAITDTFDGFSGRGPMGEHLRNRAELVAVTETAEAYAEGNDIIRDQLAADGRPVEKAWVTSNDSRVTEECLGNEGAGWISHDDVFPSGAHREPRFPGCRCVTTTRVASATAQES